MSAKLSPLTMIVPKGLLVFLLTQISTASSRTKFIYSSKPNMIPSSLNSVFSKSQIYTRALERKKPNISPYLKNTNGFVIIGCFLGSLGGSINYQPIFHSSFTISNIKNAENNKKYSNINRVLSLI